MTFHLPLRASCLGLFLLATLLAGCANHSKPQSSAADQRCTSEIERFAGPMYPSAARAAKTEGWVVVLYDLDGSGRARNVRVDESQPQNVFDAAAVRTIEETLYKRDAVRKNCRQVFNFVLSPRPAG
ncbi:TonB family protein [Variovorax sp. J2P1-59]|uniref:TonB family protein n=1 Tax=Variovorax flavidus TaxID=3053501 RepID=UPI002575A36E|nr:TonB family protein [Variovorax sp. J2P1-59]MDM0076977.1 TonB family protein [Variovorax sp. J2P1-59]